MSKIVGVDSSSKVLACALMVAEDGGADLINTVSIKPKVHWPIERRLKYMDDELMRLLSFKERGGWSANVMAVEKPMGHMRRMMMANNALWRTIGHCESIANRLGMDFRFVGIADWRRTSGIKGRKRVEVKAAAIQAVKTIFGKTLPEDEAEAVLIARHYALTRQ